MWNFPNRHKKILNVIKRFMSFLSHFSGDSPWSYPYIWPLLNPTCTSYLSTIVSPTSTLHEDNYLIVCMSLSSIWRYLSSICMPSSISYMKYLTIYRIHDSVMSDGDSGLDATSHSVGDKLSPAKSRLGHLSRWQTLCGLLFVVYVWILSLPCFGVTTHPHSYWSHILL